MSSDEGEEKQTTKSISKGCFLFKPEKPAVTSPRKRRRSSKKPVSEDIIAKCVKQFKNENVAEKLKRHKMFNEEWENVSSKIDAVRSRLNGQLFSSMLEFVDNSYPEIQQEENSMKSLEIPTAALITGVNLPDHDVTFHELTEQLNESVTKFTSKIKSKDCTTIKFMMQATLDGLESSFNSETTLTYTSAATSADEDDQDMEQVTTKKKGKQRKNKHFPNYTFNEMKEWYHASCESTREEETESATTGPWKKAQPPIVFILEDFEGFSTSVLQDFILICSEHICDVPIILMFGIATSATSIQRLIPHAVSNKLSVEKFQALPSLACLTQVIDEVLIDQKSAFKLGPKVFRLLYEYFLYHDFSLSNFIRGLKFSMMHHFYNNPLSILCHNDMQIMKEFIQGRSTKQIEQYKHIPSMSSYIDKKSLDEQKKLANDENYLKETIVQSIINIKKTEASFYPAVKCLFVLTSKLPTNPIGKRLRDTYEFCARSSSITKSQGYQQALSLLRLQSRDELQPLLESCRNIFLCADQSTSEENSTSASFEYDILVLTDFLDRFENADDLTEASIVVDDIATTSQPSPLTMTTAKPSTPAATFRNRTDFMAQMKSAVKSVRKESPYMKLRNEIVDELDNMFKKYLLSPLLMPFWEIFYFDELEIIKKQINGCPRVSLQHALSAPWTYLNCACCDANSENIQSELPDICILYQLHLECGKLINLYDWLQAFISIVNPDVASASSKKKKTKKVKELEEQIQARFIRGVSELQFLGFIKPSKKKTDHVQRLTWGGC